MVSFKLKFFLMTTTIISIVAAVIFYPQFTSSAFAASPEEEKKNNDLINAYRAGNPPDVDTRAEIVKMLIEVRAGDMSPEAFYQKVSKLRIPAGQELRHTLMEVKKDVGNYMGEAGLKQIFGEIHASGGTFVEAKILTHRKAVVMDTIKQAIQIYAKTNPKFSMYYGEVGGWPTESFKDLKFAGDIDFNFLAGDLKVAMELKKVFDDLIVKRYGQTPEALDIPCTVHGMATAEVYVGKHGQAFAESVTKKAWPINFDPSKGPVGVVSGEVTFKEALRQMVMEAKMAANPLDDLEALKWPNQPGISLEMIRHFEHDIVGKNVYTDLESFVKAAKYAERSFKFLKEDLGEDAIKDKILYKLTQDLTIHKADPKMQVDLIKAYFQAKGVPLPFEVDLSVKQDGKSIATIRANEKIIREFWDLCRRTMWESANVKIKMLVTDMGRRIASLDDADANGAKAIYDELSKYHEMLEIEDLILRDPHAGVHEHLDAEYQKVIVEFRDLVKAFKQKIAKNGLLKYIDPQTGKTYAWVEEMLKGDAEFNIKMAGAAIMALPKSVNNFLDFMDDGLMQKMRTGQGGDEYIRILRNGRGYYWSEQADQFLKGTRFQGLLTVPLDRMETVYDAQLQKTTDWLNQNLESKLASRGLKLVTGGMGAIQTVNNTFNQSVANSTAGQATMTAMMVYNLKDELPIYYNLLEKGDWEGLGAEFFRRRVPFGSAVERGVMGDYYGVAWEVTSTLVPPVALFRVAASIGESLALSGFEAYFDEEMDIFIDSLYEGAKFRITGVETVGEDIKISRWELLSVAYGGKTYDYHELINLESEGAREMQECLRKPTEQRTECFPMEKIRDGLFEWFRNEDAFRHQFKKTDPWIQLIQEMEDAPHVGDKLEAFFRYQKYARLEQIKVEFLKRTKEKLEERRAGEQAVMSGNLPRMYDELMAIVDNLDVRVQFEDIMDEKFGGEISQFFTWMKDYLRGAIRSMRGDVDVWDIYEELSSYITENLSVYQKIYTGRKEAEVYLINTEDQGLRFITGPYFLKGESESDEAFADKWLELPGQLEKDLTLDLSTIKVEEEAEPADLDTKEGSYDLDILTRLVYHSTFKDLWRHVNSTFSGDSQIASYLGQNPSWQTIPNKEGVMSDQDRAQMRYKFHEERVKELLKEFREHYQALKDKKFGLDEKLAKLEALLASALSIEKQAGPIDTNLTNAVQTLERNLKSLEGSVGKLATDVQQLSATIEEQNPNINAIIDDQFIVDQAGEDLAELRHSMESNTLSTCEMYKEIQAADNLNDISRIFGRAKDYFEDVKTGFADYQKFQSDIDAAQKRVEAERKKTGGAEKLLKRYDPTFSSLQTRLEGLRAQLTNIQNMAGAITGFENQVNGIAGEAVELVESSQPASGQRLSETNQAILKQMEKVLDNIKAVQARVVKISEGAAAKKDGAAALFASLENSLKDSQALIDALKQEYSGNSQKDRLEQVLADFQASVDAASVFKDPILEAKKNAGICMDAAQKQFDKKSSPDALTAALDCSMHQNTYAKWDDRDQEAECVCLAGYEWNMNVDGCVKDSYSGYGDDEEEPAVDCSAYPNTRPEWDASIGQYRCNCVSGMTWDQNQGKCVSMQQQQPADCSMYPNTTPQWDASINQYRCNCINGMTWDQNQGRCVTQQQGVNCAAYPGTQSQWNNYTQQYECVCSSGTQWDPNQGKCVSPNQAKDCSLWPGSVPMWNSYYNQWDCSCPDGTSWNTSQGKCAPLTQQAPAQGDCSQWPGTSPQYDAYGGYQCVCPSGTQWDQNQGRCGSGAKPIDCSMYPNTEPVWLAEFNAYKCHCVSGMEWDWQGRCVKSKNPANNSSTGTAGDSGGTGQTGTGSSGSGSGAGTGTGGTGAGGNGSGGAGNSGGGGGTGGFGGGGNVCPDGSIALLGVCGATGN